MRTFIFSTLRNIVEHNDKMVAGLIADLGAPVVTAEGNGYKVEYPNVYLPNVVAGANTFVKLAIWTSSQMPMIGEHLQRELDSARSGKQYHAAIAFCWRRWDQYNEGLITSVEAVEGMYKVLKPFCG